MAIEIRKLLVLSTSHVTDPATRESMDRPAHEWDSVNGGPTSYGWLCYANDEDPDGSIPADLWACMVFARLHGCDYILFDRDAEQVDGLPWEDF